MVNKASFPALRQTRSMMFWVLLAIGIAFVSRQINSAPEVPQLTVAEAKALVDEGAMVIDVRGSEAFGHRHIPGAINLPLSVLQSGLPSVLSEARARKIVVYCNDGVRTGPDATRILNDAGFTLAANVHSGIEGWVAAGHPIAR